MTIMGSTNDVAGSPAVKSASSWITSDDRRVAETSGAITYRLAWSTARYSAYSGHQVRYATRTGASATIAFTGTGIAWMGPVGPTRGTARVYIDGKAVASVDLRRSVFVARKLLFSKALPAGPHTFRIVVTSSGRPVAIDNLIIGS
jgi:hypothetical protein